jgi:regulation of enolase protein 1 (concanavalin A-like superfamily)
LNCSCPASETSSLDLATILYKDSLNSPPAKPWEWIRENPDAHRSGKNGLEIKIEPGGLMGDGKDARNILVRPLPEGAKSVMVQVDADHETQFEQAGLILYQDDDTYIKLVLEMVDGEVWIVSIVEIEAKAALINKVSRPDGEVRIALDLEEGKVKTSCWGKEGKPIELGAAEFPMKPLPRVGVFTQSGQPEADRWARFCNFIISAKPAEPWK